jgi:histidine triad (HIT) family protein
VPEDCTFCKIASGDLPAQVVEEDQRTLAFMDINPWTRGHALVIPRAHARNVYDVSVEDLSATAATARRVALRMRDRLGSDGVNLLHSAEPAAAQIVFHFHVHVVPRYRGDGLRLAAPAGVAKDDLAAVAAELRG